MGRHQYVSMDRIFSKLDRDITDEFPEDKVIEWTGEALEFMSVPKSYEPYVAFIEVRNHQAVIPMWTHQIHAVARNNAWTGKGCKELCPSTIQSCLNGDTSEDCNVILANTSCACPPADAVWLDCDGKPIVAYDLAYYRPYFNLKLESFHTFANTNYYRANYTPVRLSTNSMFGSIVCEQRPEIYASCKDEYQIVDGNILRFSFREGAVAVAFDRQKVDVNTGYPMIPDSISHTTAIIWYITKQIFTKEFYRGRDGAQAKMTYAEGRWNWYCGQASSADKMIVGEDEHQNFLDQRQRMLPTQNSYYGFFGNLNDPEYRVWNHRYHGGGNVYRGEGVRPVGSGGDDIVIANSDTIIQDQWDSLNS